MMETLYLPGYGEDSTAERDGLGADHTKKDTNVVSTKPGRNTSGPAGAVRANQTGTDWLGNWKAAGER
jgi:hypothetical protein